MSRNGPPWPNADEKRAGQAVKAFLVLIGQWIENTSKGTRHASGQRRIEMKPRESGAAGGLEWRSSMRMCKIMMVSRCATRGGSVKEKDNEGSPAVYFFSAIERRIPALLLQCLNSRRRATRSENSPISYQLHLVLEKSTVITVGKLGRFAFPAGKYVYTGSARRNMAARVARHLAISKPMRWHIDYLLSHPHCRVLAVSTFSETECEVNRLVDGAIIAPGFGSTDCRNGCGSHLKHTARL